MNDANWTPDARLAREFARVMMDAGFDRTANVTRQRIDRPRGSENGIYRAEWTTEDDNQSPFSEAASAVLRTNGDTAEDRRSEDGFGISRGLWEQRLRQERWGNGDTMEDDDQ